MKSSACEDSRSQIDDALKALTQRVLTELKLKPQELADQLSLHHDLIRKWVRKERRPQLEQIIEMATMVGASLDEVFGVGLVREEMELSQRIANAVVDRVFERLGGLSNSREPLQGDPGRKAERAPGAGRLAHEMKDELPLAAKGVLEEIIHREGKGRKRRSA